MYVFGNDYSGLFGAGQQVGRDATSDWFHYANMVQGLDQQAAEQARQAQADQQRQADAAMQWRWTMQKDQYQKQQDALNRNMEERRFAWDRTKENVGSKRLAETDSLNTMKALLPVADDGTLENSQMDGLLDTHKAALIARRDAARKLLEAEQATLSKAGDSVDRETTLKHYIDEEQQAKPAFYNPFRWGGARYQDKIADWQNQLTALTGNITPDQRQAAKTLPLDEETMLHGAPPPLPWLRGRTGAPMVTMNSTKALTPDLAKGFLAQAGGDKDKARAMAKAAGFTF